MEKGSSSSAANGPGDSLNGLKFGKKIYFEDVGGGGGSSSKSMTATASPAAAATGKKGKGVAQAGVQPKPARCQVEGCNLDLIGAKAYYCRHKVCGLHSKSPKVIVAGLEQRFCQQCSRFHLLSEFDQGKRSCRRRLAGHNERRRKPPAGPLTSRCGRLSSFHGAEDSSRYKSYLMDLSYSRSPDSAGDVWPTMRSSDHAANNQWQGRLDAHLGIVTNNSYPTLFSASELAQGDCLAGVSDSSCALSLLSTQPWGAAAIAAASRNQGASLFSVSTGFDAGGPMAQLNMASSYMNSPWAFKDHGSGSSSSLEMGLGQMPVADNGRFSSELDLALQGNRPCPDYDHDHHAMHWSL